MTCRRDDRSVIRVCGADAAAFLQNLLTNDVARLDEGRLLYACLLTPQGRLLHDLFLFRQGGDFFLDCEAARREDLLRRLTVFRLRAKVALEDCHGALQVYSAPAAPPGIAAYADPRLPALGARFYLPENAKLAADVSRETERDRRIALGIAEGTPDMRPETDTLFDLNLDRLNAVSWGKGCYVGQEVTARIHHRGLVKKRLAIVSGANLAIGALMQDGHAIGEIRSMNAARTQGLAIVKLAALAEAAPLTQDNGAAVAACLPAWLQSC